MTNGSTLQKSQCVAAMRNPPMANSTSGNATGRMVSAGPKTKCSAHSLLLGSRNTSSFKFCKSTIQYSGEPPSA